MQFRNMTPPFDPMKSLEGNPDAAKYLEMIKGGMSAKEAFFQACKDKGIDPTGFLSQLAGMK